MHEVKLPSAPTPGLTLTCSTFRLPFAFLLPLFLFLLSSCFRLPSFAFSSSSFRLPFVYFPSSFRPPFNSLCRIINDFDDGVLDAPPGVGLRQLLASKLRCEVMRVSKKFCGWACVGKRSFRPVRHPDGRASRVS